MHAHICIQNLAWFRRKKVADETDDATAHCSANGIKLVGLN